MKNSELQGEEKVKSDALRFLAASPRSVEELRSRLKLKKHPDSAIEPVIELLKKQGFLNDQKFAQLYAGSRVNARPVGRRQLEMDLKKKGLSSGVVEEALSNLKDYDEKEAVRKLAQGRFSRMTGVSPEKKKARLFGFLKRRGFESNVIFSVMNETFLALEEDLVEDRRIKNNLPRFFQVQRSSRIPERFAGAGG